MKLHYLLTFCVTLCCIGIYYTFPRESKELSNAYLDCELCKYDVKMIKNFKNEKDVEVLVKDNLQRIVKKALSEHIYILLELCGTEVYYRSCIRENILSVCGGYLDIGLTEEQVCYKLSLCKLTKN